MFFLKIHSSATLFWQSQMRAKSIGCNTRINHIVEAFRSYRGTVHLRLLRYSAQHTTMDAAVTHGNMQLMLVWLEWSSTVAAAPAAARM